MSILSDIKSKMVERFMEKVEPEPMSGCWLWSGSAYEGGYGVFSVPVLGNMSAHRVSYELMVGEIPEGLELDHKCRTPSCVNPDHLEPVTHKENVSRGNAGNYWSSKTHCPKGHEYAGLNVYMYRGRRFCRACKREHSASKRESIRAKVAA